MKKIFMFYFSRWGKHELSCGRGCRDRCNAGGCTFTGEWLHIRRFIINLTTDLRISRSPTTPIILQPSFAET